ncbi:MAG: porin [Mediterranea massiliensis]|nr:porin [Mediterranea massiliensis]
MKTLQTIILSAALLTCNHAMAQTKVAEQAKKDLVQNTTFGGYVIGKASANNQAGKTHSSFDLRLARVYVNGQVLDFKYRLQMEVNGAPGADKQKSPRIVDAYGEWVKYKFFQVRFGQFKRAFTFENPMNPWDIGFGGYSQMTDKLAGMNDRIGEHSSGGRDIGLQVQGDFLPVGNDRHNFIHYQVAVYNGQGINHGDANNSKDLIGGLYVYPVKNLAVGAFGWSGSYTKNGITVDRNRMSFGVKYESNWTVRAEYATSQGHRLSDYREDGTVTGNGRADGWYATVGAPVTDKLKIYAKWDAYREAKEWSNMKSLYCLSANYYFTKNLKLQANYSYTYDKSTSADRRYNTLDLQLYWRF